MEVNYLQIVLIDVTFYLKVVLNVLKNEYIQDRWLKGYKGKNPSFAAFLVLWKMHCERGTMFGRQNVRCCLDVNTGRKETFQLPSCPKSFPRY